MSNELKGIIEDNSFNVKVQITESGPRGEKGIQGIPGETGKSIEYTWNGTQLGVRIEGETNYTYVNLKGDKGDIGNTGKSLEFTWNGTQLGIRQEGDATFQYVNLKGDKGDTGEVDYTKKIQATTGIINLSLANVFTDTPSASRTYSITNAKSGVAHSFTLIITIGATVHTLTFPNSVKWQGEEIPDMTESNKTYILTFMTIDGGTTWLGMSGGKFNLIPIMATDEDFNGETDGTFKYIGYHVYVYIPHVIKGVNVTSYASMFRDNASTILKGVASDNPNVTNMSSMFFGSQATTLDLSSFDTSNVTNMQSMFNTCQATTLDLSSFDTSKVTNMYYMFASSQATTLDLSSFDTSNVTDMRYMFSYSQATTGYARTQADADRFNASSNKPAGLTFVVK